MPPWIHIRSAPKQIKMVEPCLHTQSLFWFLCIFRSFLHVQSHFDPGSIYLGGSKQNRRLFLADFTSLISPKGDWKFQSTLEGDRNPAECCCGRLHLFTIMLSRLQLDWIWSRSFKARIWDPSMTSLLFLMQSKSHKVFKKGLKPHMYSRKYQFEDLRLTMCKVG